MPVYAYEFDRTTAHSASHSRQDFEVQQEALRLLEGKVRSWNEIALANGALQAPYAREVEDLGGMIEWGDGELSDKGKRVIRIGGISIGSLRYLKAAYLHAAWHCEMKITQTAKESWPGAVIEAMRGKVRRYQKMAEEISYAPAAILDELRPEYGQHAPKDGESTWDAFVSHASEDKDDFARPVAEALRARGYKIWYDEFALTLGDSLRRSIDRGLARSRFGVVILSPRFMAKEWPQKELDGLVAREIDGRKVILPVWHGIDANTIRKFSPTLADRVAISSSVGIPAVVDALVAAMKT